MSIQKGSHKILAVWNVCCVIHNLCRATRFFFSQRLFCQSDMLNYQRTKWYVKYFLGTAYAISIPANFGGALFLLISVLIITIFGPRLLIWQGSTASSPLCTVTLVSVGRNSGSVNRSFFIVNTEKMQGKDEQRHVKTNKMSVRLEKISLSIRPVWSESAWRKLGSLATH